MVVGSRLHNIKFVICPQNAFYHSISFYIELEYCCPYMKRSTNKVTPILSPFSHPSIPLDHSSRSSSSIELASNEHSYRCTIHQHIFPGPHPNISRHRSSELKSDEHSYRLERQLPDVYETSEILKWWRKAFECCEQKTSYKWHKTSRWGDMSETNDPDLHQCRKRGRARNDNT